MFSVILTTKDFSLHWVSKRAGKKVIWFGYLSKDLIWEIQGTDEVEVLVYDWY
jgi:hypothetical protein